MLKRLLSSSAAAAIFLAACATPPATHADLDGVSKAPPALLEVAFYDGDFVDIQQFDTPGGVSVWLVTEPSIPIVSVQMAWRGGSIADPDGLEGLGQAVVYGMNEGAGDLDSLGFQTAMEDLNMSFGCSNGSEWTSCSATMLSDNAAASMALVASALTAPRFDQGPFERFVREQEVSLRTRETSAGYLAWRAQSQALYPGHPFAREVSPESLAALTPDLARAHKDALMTKDRLIVTAVGAISPEELAVLIDAAIAGLPETGEVPAAAPVKLPEVAATEPVVVSLPQPQSLVRFIGPAMDRSNPDFFPAFVLNYTFGGGGFESRLVKTLRVEKGLTYGVSSSIDPNPSFTVWSGGGQTKNESAGEFITGIRDEMQKFIEGGVTEAELSDAKAYLIGSYPLGFDSNAKIAGNIMSIRQDDLGIDYFDRRNALIEAVTLEDVNRVAATYLAPERFSFFVVGEPEGLGPVE
ncbi:MAG: insulinase family protein [Alphaproteobacteria bacterium HGW-Alphaproteobacteria-18]|nr:MAG: insulinase family protein [Alphaproteobacteria bacterium HGW-Alphaproteobacteria-18]